MHYKTKLVLVNLRKINRLLRWTGFRLFVGYDPAHKSDTIIGLGYHGWEFIKYLRNDLKKK